MTWELGQFHFMRPLYLWLIPVAIVLWYICKQRLSSSHWEEYLPKAMVSVLQVKQAQQISSLQRCWQWGLFASLIILIMSVAGPTWTKQAVPTLSNQQALVLVLDLSPSMLAEDLLPNRLARAKLKLIDILRQRRDGQTALIAYAGDAHAVSPLTDDPRTIEALLPALHPSVMPSQGSNTEAAIQLAKQLLNDARTNNGEILLISDGVTNSAIKTIQRDNNGQHHLSVLGVGGIEPTPVPTQGGGFLRNTKGEIVLSSLDSTTLADLASSLGGRFATVQTSDADIQFLLNDGFEAEQNNSNDQDNRFDAWVDMGHWLVLLILPIILVCFRKGLIYVLPLIFIMPIDSKAQEAAIDSQANQTWLGQTWKNLWQTENQQGAELFNQEDYGQAATTFNSPEWSAAAHYRAGNFAEAAKRLKDADNTADNLYNKGNALAMNGQFKEAIDAFEHALQKDPDHPQAGDNKKLIEKLLKQQSQKQEGQQQSPQQQDSTESSSSDQSESNEQQGNDGQQNNDAQQGNQQENDDSQNGEQQKDNNTPEQADSQQQTESESQSNAPSEESNAAQDSAEQDDLNAQNSQAEDQQEQTGEEQQSLTQDEEQKADENATEALTQERQGATAKPDSNTQLQDSSEQWLRTIQDDPSGFLRRKFRSQAQQRQRNRPASSSNEERY